MSKIISIHSFRGGTGKSNLIANLAVLIALQGKRVAIVDTDLQSPGIHALFNIDNQRQTLNDYLWNRISITEAAYDISDYILNQQKGQLFLIPASINPEDIAKILSEGYNVSLLNSGFRQLIQELNLDYLFIDTHPGLSRETLLSIAISNLLIIILRPDRQDFQGTDVTVNIARQLQLKNIMMTINKTPINIDWDELQQKVEKNYNFPVSGIFPLSPEMAELGSKGIFSLQYPDHYFTHLLHKFVDNVIQKSRLHEEILI
ncbi:MinD/ParA family protein [Calothrix sp. UHCC 0171]|uniref:MinD/ParA family ATP-binding protein n=1 Tax=Calothrix sp. UHCC 0171 TaxID=3110245 RepID=UPI002B209712|nr:MinD/ParA family protein [Calothrix sp. UHCC 0171]MEA5574622.1 MinD/ParA family protein [Calothrix sp. UHCC 0171]